MLARSSYAYVAPSFRTQIDIEIPDADGFYVRLSEDHNYGFARLEKIGGSWSIDSDYQVNLVQGQAPPLVALLSGDECIEDGEQGYYSATASGGTPPYTIEYYSYRLCNPLILAPNCNEWTYAGSGSSILFGGYGEDFKMKATVTDAASQSDDSGELLVDVVPWGSGWCEEAGPERTQTAASKTVEGAASAEVSPTELPESTFLGANYPNPFNPTTEIRFGLPEDLDVSLTVFDLMGHRVALLVDGPLSAGVHSVLVDGSSLPSGTYFYRLVAGSDSRTGRMTLLK